jgi:hypothetical protein
MPIHVSVSFRIVFICLGGCSHSSKVHPAPTCFVLHGIPPRSWIQSIGFMNHGLQHCCTDMTTDVSLVIICSQFCRGISALLNHCDWWGGRGNVKRKCFPRRIYVYFITEVVIPILISNNERLVYVASRLATTAMCSIRMPSWIAETSLNEFVTSFS